MNPVVAGPTRTGGAEDFVREPLAGRDLPWDEAQHAFMREHRPQSLLRRLVEPEEIARMVVHLSSGQASATMGGALRVAEATSIRSCPEDVSREPAVISGAAGRGRRCRS